VPALPLLGALIAAAGGRWLKDQAHLPVVAGIVLAFFASLGLLGSPMPGETVVYRWLDATGLEIPVVFRVDGLATMMASMVTFVASLIAIFSVGYMAGYPGYPRFFALIGLFVFSMTGLVLSSNYVLTYAFWEGVGACSYLLVGFWYFKPAAAAAAKKAFMVNRVGDFGFAIALMWLWKVMPNHSLSYDVVLNPANLAALPVATKTGLALLLFWAATAKSAQIPLYVWLPDAMEGPTPVSALIHAATMVTAGVYVVARSSMLFVTVPSVQVLMSSIGALTALLAAAIAVTQTDLKRVLAYSTISQLGYMFMALGAGIASSPMMGRLGQGIDAGARLAIISAMFHLFTHAFFKALLFLGAGSVMHSMGGVIDMRRFRGLRHRMPITCWTFAVGGLALAGIVPTAGFWSKDEILSAVFHAHELTHHQGYDAWSVVYLAVYLIAVFTVFLTAFYTGRAFFLTFFGPEKLPSPHDPEAPLGETHESHASTPHPGDEPSATHEHHVGDESPAVMTNPLIALALCAVFVGLLFGPTGVFEHHLMRTPGFGERATAEHGYDWLTALVGTLVAVGGLVWSWFLYAEPSEQPARLAARLRPLYLASQNKFWVDEFYNKTVIAFTRAMAVVAGLFDDHVIHNLLVRGAAWVPRYSGRRFFAPYQNGLIQFYAAVTALGVAVLLCVLLLI
jgi:NADH-quinone oxidoreductase subunit L